MHLPPQTRRLVAREKVKDACEHLGRQDRNRREGVAPNQQRAQELPRRVDFLIDRGDGRAARVGVVNDGVEMTISGFDPGEYIGEDGRRLRVTLIRE